MDEQRIQLIEQLLEVFEKFGTNSKDADAIYQKSNKSAEQFQKEIDKLTKSSKKQATSYADMKKKMDELDDAIEDLSDSTDATTAAQNQAKKVVLQKMKADLAAEAATKALGEAARKATSDLIGGAAKTAGQFVKSLQNDASSTALASELMTATIDVAAGSMKTAGGLAEKFGDKMMNSANPWVAGIGVVTSGLGVLAKESADVAAKLAKFGVEILAKEVEKTYKAFNQMSASGAMFADGMTGMRNASAGAGLTLEQMSNAVKGSSEKIASAGMSVTDGTKMLGRVGKSLKDSGAQEQLLKLGFGFEEQVALMADVTKQMRLTGKAITDKDVADQTKKYAENLRLIASITGEDAKKKMAIAEEASKELAFRQELATKSPEQQAAIQEAMTSMTELEMKNFKDRVVFHGAVINEEGAMYEAQVKAAKDKGKELYNAFSDNTLTYQKGAKLNAQFGEQINKSIFAMKGIGRAAYVEGDMKDFGASLSKQIDANNTYTKAAVDGSLATLKVQDSQEELTKGLIGAEIAAQKLKVGLEKELLPFIKDFVDISTSMLGQVTSMLDDLPGAKERKAKEAEARHQEEVKKEEVAKKTIQTENKKIAEEVAPTVPSYMKEAMKQQNMESDQAYQQRIKAYKDINWGGAHDKGGAIGAGKVGIAGENGPELIGGPSSVLSTLSTGKLLDIINVMKLQAGSLTGEDGMDKTVVNSPALQAEIARQLQGLNQTIADSAVSTKGPSSVLSNATVESLVTAIDAMREMKGTRTGANDFDWQVGMSEGRMAKLKDRVKGFEGFDANQLQEEFMKRPEADPIKRARKQMDDEEYGTTATNSAETNAHLAELVKLMKDNVDHTAKVAANTN